MHLVKIDIKLFSINELEENSRMRAMEEHRDFLLSVFDSKDYGFEYGYGAYEDDLADGEEVLNSIGANDYLFFKDGNLANVTHYCGKHSRSGETVLTFDGNEYLL